MSLNTGLRLNKDFEQLQNEIDNIGKQTTLQNQFIAKETPRLATLTIVGDTKDIEGAKALGNRFLVLAQRLGVQPYPIVRETNIPAKRGVYVSGGDYHWDVVEILNRFLDTLEHFGKWQ